MSLQVTAPDGEQYLFDDHQEKLVQHLYDEVINLRRLLEQRKGIVVAELLANIERQGLIIRAKEEELKALHSQERASMDVIDATLGYLDA